MTVADFAAIAGAAIFLGLALVILGETRQQREVPVESMPGEEAGQEGLGVRMKRVEFRSNTLPNKVLGRFGPMFRSVPD